MNAKTFKTGYTAHILMSLGAFLLQIGLRLLIGIIRPLRLLQQLGSLLISRLNLSLEGANSIQQGTLGP